MRIFFASIATLSLFFSLPACGGDDESGCTEPDGGDGKLHPAPNGVHTAEDAACTALTKALGDKAMSLHCVYTAPVCPQFLRSDYGEGKEYDQGSIDGCIAFYDAKTSCPDFTSATKGCALTIYPTPKPPKACP